MTPTQPALSIDFYKADHRSQYQPRTELVYSNFTPRSAKLFNATRYFDGKVVVFGLQIFIKDYRAPYKAQPALSTICQAWPGALLL